MRPDFGYDDDIAKDFNCELNRSELPKLQKKNGHNNHFLKTSHCSAGLIPWYTSGFE